MIQPKNIFKILFAIIIYFSLTSCDFLDCKEDINKLPMYGDIEKCYKQIEADKVFLRECDNEFKNRVIASKYYVDRAWEYYHKNHLDSSMMRFNQAWLLNNQNPDIYWGFGSILGMRKDYKSSLYYFERSIEINPNNIIVWQSFATSYGNLFLETKEVEYLDKTVETLKNSLELDSQNVLTIAALAGSYSYFKEKDSALKYLKLTDQVDSTKIHPDVRERLNGKH